MWSCKLKIVSKVIQFIISFASKLFLLGFCWRSALHCSEFSPAWRNSWGEFPAIWGAVFSSKPTNIQTFFTLQRRQIKDGRRKGLTLARVHKHISLTNKSFFRSNLSKMISQDLREFHCMLVKSAKTFNSSFQNCKSYLRKFEKYFSIFWVCWLLRLFLGELEIYEKPFVAKSLENERRRFSKATKNRVFKIYFK